MAELFARNEHNPLITTRDLPYQANAVFNAGAADLGDEVVLLLRVESTSGRSHLTVARSKNGVTGWTVADRALLHPAQGFPHETFGIEDCRITWMEDLDVWGLAYTAYSEHGPGIAIALTTDFETVERVGLAFPPDDKDACLFPRRFDGHYAMLHRPAVGGGSIWIAYSPDLVFWGKTDVVVPLRGGPWWDGLRVGAGLPPIETEEGWLVIYHGVKEALSRPLYRLGAALLDLEDPHRMIARARRWMLAPREPYEQVGDAPNVVFPCGGFVRDQTLWVYYGAADSCICLATAPLEDVLELVMAEPV
jgi:predicted GH43/DUF377 family glycosyl hydrolase